MAQIPVILFLYYVYCFTAASDPCTDYEDFNADSTRSPSHIEAVYANANCDATLDERWYRITGDAGTDLTNDSGLIPSNGCGTFYQMWMSGSIPEEADGIVDRTICLKTVFSSCQSSFTIQVKSCCSFRVYDLKSSSGCPHSYCVSDTGFVSTDSCLDNTTTTTEETTVATAYPTATAIDTTNTTQDPTATAIDSSTTTQDPTATAIDSSTTTQDPTATAIDSTTTIQDPTATAFDSTATTQYPTTTTNGFTTQPSPLTTPYTDSETSLRPQKDKESTLTIVKQDNTLIVIVVLVIVVTAFTAVIGVFVYTLKLKKTVRSNSLMPLVDTTSFNIDSSASSPPPGTYMTDMGQPPPSYAFIDPSIQNMDANQRIAKGGNPGGQYHVNRVAPDLASRQDFEKF